MRILIFIIIIVVSILTGGCTDEANHLSKENSIGYISIIDSLSFRDLELPEKVTDQHILDCKKAIKMAVTIKDETLELGCLIRLFELQIKAENYTEALQTSKLALDMATNIGNKESLADVYSLIGKNHYRLAVFHKAFEYLDIALKLYKELNDTTNIQDVMNYQGNIYFCFNDYDMAYSYYEKNLELSKTRKDNIGIAKALTNIGIIYLCRSCEEGVPDDSIVLLENEAVECISNALLFSSKEGQKLITAEILFNLADVYRSSGDFTGALIAIKEALKISRDLSDRVYIWSNISYSNILIDLDSIDAAQKILESTLKLAEENNMVETMIKIHSKLSWIYQENGEYEIAYYHLNQYSDLYGSVYNLDYKMQIDAIKVASDMEAEEKEAGIEQQQLYYQSTIIIFLLISVIIIVFLFYSRLRQRTTNIDLENKLLNERLETRNRELTTRVMALIQRNEIEREIVQKLNTLKQKLKIENQREVQDIIRSLSFKQNEQLWKEFEIRFESVHNDFFSNISRNYPELTTNEKRLCSFLYLDMSSKDISAITGQSIRALNVARTRLRKRFNLTNDSLSLSAFLNSI
jgi:tetratricopeptide (TPR) repeat protein